MESFVGLLIAAHALAGVVMLAGLIGRWIVLGLAERADTLGSMRTLAAAARPFERIVIVVPTFVLVIGVLVGVVQGRPMLGPLQGAAVDWLFVSIVLFLSVPVLVPTVFLPRGRVFEAALADATSRGEITPELTAAWRDPVTRAAHVYELGVTSIVFVLMVTKPF